MRHLANRDEGNSARMNIKNFVFSTILFVAATILGLGALEMALRVKNSSMKNYDIEMWRYAKELKIRSQDPALGHVHLKNKSALLQSVDIRTNEWGLRGPPLNGAGETARRILFLGGSITLGWGVPEEDTVSARVEKGLRELGESVEVFNGGIGNYNAQRYVERFFVELKDLNPTDIVVQYFLRDAEDLDPGRDNWILRNSDNAYHEDSIGFRNMHGALQKLADYAKANNIRIYLVMTPDVHNLKDYQFGFVHERMKRMAAELGYTYVDLLGAFGTLSPEEVWAMPGDPHPNALGHKLMAEAIIPVVAIGK
jgi:hypothetical protein